VGTESTAEADRDAEGTPAESGAIQMLNASVAFEFATDPVIFDTSKEDDVVNLHACRGVPKPYTIAPAFVPPHKYSVANTEDGKATTKEKNTKANIRFIVKISMYLFYEIQPKCRKKLRSNLRFSLCPEGHSFGETLDLPDDTRFYRTTYFRLALPKPEANPRMRGDTNAALPFLPDFD